MTDKQINLIGIIYFCIFMLLIVTILSVYTIDASARPNTEEYKGIQINDINFCKDSDNKNLAIFVNNQIVYHLDCEK